MNRIPTKKLTCAALMLSLSLLLPTVVHMTGLAGGGKVLLPMHLPVLLAGFLLGPVGGALLGLIAPSVSFLFLGMPSAFQLPFMSCELFGYGFAAGLLFRLLRGRKGGILLSLVGAMVFGRLLNALSLLAAASLFGVENASVAAVLTATTTGAVGILVQFAVVLPTVYALERGHYFDNNQ